jgi:predicted P-loop ATPase
MMVSANAWFGQLVCYDSGAPKPIVGNAIIALRDAPEWAGKLWFDVFHQRAVLRGEPPWGGGDGERIWDDDCDRRATEWLQRIPEICCTTKVTCEAVETVAREQKFHPVVDYLQRCRWDGEPRLDDWTIRYLGAVCDPPTRPADEIGAHQWELGLNYIRAVSSRWMICAVARVMEPGCKADSALVLEGRQGLLKSTAIRTLAYPWFTDEIAELGTKDSAIALAGVWVVELGELSSMKHGKLDKVKAFMSRQTDRYRPPYGRRTIEQSRQCVFAGSVNDNEYLPDESGNRRWWPIRCTKIDIDGLSEIRDQLWAEARDRYIAGECRYLDTPELNQTANKEQTARYQPDPWHELIIEWLGWRIDISVNEILRDALKITEDRLEQRDMNRVARCLRAMGWERYQLRTGSNRGVWRYRRAVP